MKFLKLDKKKGSGGPAIKSRYAFLIYLDDIAYLPPTNDKGVRMEGDILLKENCTMMPLYLTSSSQEFSYDTLGDDDEKSYKVKFSGNHPGTELEALEFAKNMIEQPFLVLIPACIPADPWKLLGEITNPLIFTSSHKATKDSSRFTFNFEQRIGSEYIYFSYGGVEVPSSGDGVHPPSGGFDPTKWARIDASNIDEHVAAWREKLGIGAGSIKNYPTLSDFPIPGDIATIYKALDTDELYVWDSETETYILSSIDKIWKMAVDQGIASALTTLSGVLEEMADIQLNKANKDASEMSPANIISWQEALNIHNLQIALDAEIVNRATADLLEKNERIAADAQKADKPTTDGTWMLKKLGTAFTWVAGVMENIANTDLSNISARIFTQGNTFTWNTAGFFHYLKGLVDRTGNAAYTKVVVVHPSTGEMVTRDFSDPQATTLAVQNASAGQKAIMKNSLFGVTTPATPLINLMIAYFNPKSEDVWLFASGVNVTPLDPFACWIEDALGNKCYAISVYGISTATLQLKFNFPIFFPDGEYQVKFNYGLFPTIVALQGISIYDKTIVDYKVDIPVSDFMIKGRAGYILNNNSIILGTNTFRIAMNNTSYPTADSSLENAVKTTNVFKGSKDWTINLSILHIQNQDPITVDKVHPFILLSETSDASFNNVSDIIQNYILLKTDGYYTNTINNQRISPGSVGSVVEFTIRKTGNKVSFFIGKESVSFYSELTIDTTKDYALVAIESRYPGQSIRQITLDIKIKP